MEGPRGIRGRGRATGRAAAHRLPVKDLRRKLPGCTLHSDVVHAGLIRKMIGALKRGDVRIDMRIPATGSGSRSRPAVPPADREAGPARPI